MTRLRPTRSVSALVTLLALISMLCMQLAVAGYVCPCMTLVDEQAMSDCAGMDKQQPVLCHAHAHDQGGKQTADTPELPTVQAFVAAELQLVVQPRDDLQLFTHFLLVPSLLTHATAPPLAIQHCCFRI